DGWMPTWSPDDRALAFLCRPPVDQARPLMARPTVVCVTDATGIVRQLLAPPSEALAWSPDGAHFAIVQNLGLRMGSIGGSASLPSSTSGGVRIQGLGRPNEENVFPFRPDWLSDGEVLYTADGQIKRRPLTGSRSQTIPFSAKISLQRPSYAPVHRALEPSGPQ